MTHLHPRKLAIGASTFVCATLLSLGWSGQGGPALSIDSAQARVGRPLTPVSVAGVARRQYRRANYGYGAAAVGAGLAGAAVVGTTAAVAAATNPWGYNDSYYGNGPYVGNGGLAANAYYGGSVETTPFNLQRAYRGNGPWYGYNGWSDYKARYGIVCDPGTTFKGDDGLMHVCQ
jgi:hypothetical protein